MERNLSQSQPSQFILWKIFSNIIRGWSKFRVRVKFTTGCEYYTNLLYPVQVLGKAFRAIRIRRSDGYVDTIPERDWKKFEHYPLCSHCYKPSIRTWVWCIHVHISPCGKLADNCNPFTDKTLITHLINCNQPRCKGMQSWLREAGFWETLIQFA